MNSIKTHIKSIFRDEKHRFLNEKDAHECSSSEDYFKRVKIFCSQKYGFAVEKGGFR